MWINISGIIFVAIMYQTVGPENTNHTGNYTIPLSTYLLIYVVFQNRNFVAAILEAYLKPENWVLSGIV